MDIQEKLINAVAAVDVTADALTAQIANYPDAPNKDELEWAIAGVIHAFKPLSLDWGRVTDKVHALDVQAGKAAADAGLEKVLAGVGKAQSKAPDAPETGGKAPSRVTLSGKPASLPPESGAPQPINPETGQHGDYWVLSADERAKGFVRPVRAAYTHVGAPQPKYPLRDLTAAETERYAGHEYIKFEEYPESESPLTGRFWTQKMLDRVSAGCGRVTTMNQAIAETYARDPKFYGSTFCVDCCGHYPVSEFVWAGTYERVGT